jgi:carbon monoxide dehydrogenase subunit G
MIVAGSRRLEVSGEAVWAIVADPRRLPEWLPTVVAAHVTAEGEDLDSRVKLEGESHGHRLTR